MKYFQANAFLTDDELLRISKKIREKELLTDGEIILSIRLNKPLFYKKGDVQKLANKQSNAIKQLSDGSYPIIVLYFLAETREFSIFADREIEGLNTQTISSSINQFFKDGDFCNGLLSVIDEIAQPLIAQYPCSGSTLNKISNKVLLQK